MIIHSAQHTQRDVQVKLALPNSPIKPRSPISRNGKAAMAGITNTYVIFNRPEIQQA